MLQSPDLPLVESIHKAGSLPSAPGCVVPTPQTVLARLRLRPTRHVWRTSTATRHRRWGPARQALRSPNTAPLGRPSTCCMKLGSNEKGRAPQDVQEPLRLPAGLAATSASPYTQQSMVCATTLPGLPSCTIHLPLHAIPATPMESVKRFRYPLSQTMAFPVIPPGRLPCQR